MHLRSTFIVMALVTVFVFLSAMFLSVHAYGEASLGPSIDSLRQEVQALRDGQQELKKDLGEIKTLLLKKQEPIRKEPVSLKLPLSDGPVKGDVMAKIVVVEFSDYECPYCARHFRETLPRIEQDYISTGKIRYFFRNFPIETLHKNAMLAAEAGLCAGDQGKYWEMHDYLFAMQGALHKDFVLERGKTLGLDLGEFQRCLNGKAKHETVQSDLRSGTLAGVSGTPMFFIGRLREGGSADGAQLDVHHTISGAQPYEAFQAAIDNLSPK